MMSEKITVQEVYATKLWQTSIVKFGAMSVRNIIMDSAGTYSVQGDKMQFTETPGSFELRVEDNEPNAPAQEGEG